MILYATRWDHWLSEFQWPALVVFASHLVYVKVGQGQRHSVKSNPGRPRLRALANLGVH